MDNEILTLPARDNFTPRLKLRYKDAYNKTKPITSIGTLVIIFGILAALLYTAISFSRASSGHLITELEIPFLAISILIPAVIEMLVAYVIGKLIHAATQFMMASLDTAVYSCPTSSSQQKMEIVFGL